MKATAVCVQLVLASMLAGCNALTAQAAFPMGTHRMVLHTPGGVLPFELRFEGDGKGNLLASVHNGKEHIDVPEIVDANNELVLRFPHYDSELQLDVDRYVQKLSGHWLKRRGRGKTTKMRVENKPAENRFELDRYFGKRDTGWFAGRHRVTFAKSKDPAVGVFTASTSTYSNCAGTFLTTLGDYRFLAGNANTQQLRLSCFDGAHAFLFHGKRQDDGSIAGDFWSSDSFHEKWTAVRDDQAELPDGWQLTSWREGAELGKAKFRDLDGKQCSLDDPAWRGKPRLIEVFGTWCPNCHDHGAYTAELHRRYGERGLQVIGLAFEHDDDFARSVRQVRTFAARHGATFPILIAGLSNKQRATDSLALLDQVRSFPTTIFVDGEGHVRGIYQGWSGPATGDVHQRLRERFESLIETILQPK